jgi:hypothetical protein
MTAGVAKFPGAFCDDADALMALAGLERSDQWKLNWQTRLKPTG